MNSNIVNIVQMNVLKKVSFLSEEYVENVPIPVENIQVISQMNNHSDVYNKVQFVLQDLENSETPQATKTFQVNILVSLLNQLNIIVTMSVIVYLRTNMANGFVLKNQNKPQQLVNIIVNMMKSLQTKTVHVEYVNYKTEKKSTNTELKLKYNNQFVGQ